MTPAIPTSVAQCDAQRLKQIAQRAERYADYFALETARLEQCAEKAVVGICRELLDRDAEIESNVDAVLKLRTAFHDLPRADPQRQRIRDYLSICERLIKLNGKLHYLQRDAFDAATYRLANRFDELRELMRLLAERRSVPGAAMLAFVLDEPDPSTGLKPYPDALRMEALQLMGAARSVDSLPVLSEFVRRESVRPELKLYALEVMREIGVPQEPHPLQDPSIQPPPVTPGKLLELARQIQLSSEPTANGANGDGVNGDGVNGDGVNGDGVNGTRRLQAMIQWLEQRVRRGVTGDSFRVGRLEVKEGDWFLMRNPSPFNRFTDIAPGLFTHVGIVTALTDDRGVRRFVVTDVPERGDHVPATNVDAYVKAPLHFLFLRHEDDRVNRVIAKAAAETIGNPSQFDLLFRTDRVAQWKGKSLQDVTVHTYCAGYLLLCAQQTGLPRTEFFPVSEYSPSEQCQKNLAVLGLRLGVNYISPTGPLFSRQHKIVGGRKPFYSPSREVQAAVFDYFGEQMTNAVLTPAPDLVQSLRAKVAGLSRYNPWLARALAKANNVSPRMDLEAAAKAAAVIETLDEIANGASEEYRFARLVLANSEEELADLPAEELERSIAFRKRHADLDRRVERGEISPRELRLALVSYYSKKGKDALDRRFFSKSQ